MRQSQLIIIIFMINEHGEIYKSTFTINFALLTFDTSFYIPMVIIHNIAKNVWIDNNF